MKYKSLHLDIINNYFDRASKNYLNRNLLIKNITMDNLKDIYFQRNNLLNKLYNYLRLSNKFYMEINIICNIELFQLFMHNLMDMKKYNYCFLQIENRETHTISMLYLNTDIIYKDFSINCILTVKNQHIDLMDILQHILMYLYLNIPSDSFYMKYN